jgi:hypothetical protein
MLKYISFLIFFVLPFINGFGQSASNETYLWNSTGINYSVDDKTELVLSNKDHFNVQIGQLDYFHFDLAGYRQLSNHFSLGLGLRLNETYKTETWNPGGAYMFYGVFTGNPGNVKIRFANRVAIRTFRISDTQHTFDNITNVDFFARSTDRWPKPFLMDELFTSLDYGKVQTIRLYGGLHILKFTHVGVDLYYCYQKARPNWVWKDYQIIGINTKFRI